MNGVRSGGVERAFRAEGGMACSKAHCTRSAKRRPCEGGDSVRQAGDEQRRGPRGRIEYLLWFSWWSELHAAHLPTLDFICERISASPTMPGT